MNRVTLQFKDQRDLRRFYQIIQSDYVEMDARALTITCECSAEEIELAISAFSATVVARHPKH